MIVKDSDIVVIGDQTWTSRNLSLLDLGKGFPIKMVSSKDEWIDACNKLIPAAAFPDFNHEYAADFGVLYNSLSIELINNSLKGSDWHLPAASDYIDLLQYVGVSAMFDFKAIDGEEQLLPDTEVLCKCSMHPDLHSTMPEYYFLRNGFEVCKTVHGQGLHLKSNSWWDYYKEWDGDNGNPEPVFTMDCNGSNRFGFSIVPSGYIDHEGIFSGIKLKALMATYPNTQSGADEHKICFYFDQQEFYWKNNGGQFDFTAKNSEAYQIQIPSKYLGASVRLLKK